MASHHIGGGGDPPRARVIGVRSQTGIPVPARNTGRLLLRVSAARLGSRGEAGREAHPQLQGLHDVAPRRTPQEPREDYRSIFSNVQKGFSSGSIGLLSRHLGPQVYVNLRGGESGYYSGNQASIVLENYVRSQKIVSFTFTTIGESESNPYATGSAGFNVRGSREYAQVYVSLSLVGNRWVISQINIY